MWNPRWNDIDRGKPKDSEKNLSQYHFVYHKSHWIDPGANPGRRGERPAINRLSHGPACPQSTAIVSSTEFRTVKKNIARTIKPDGLLSGFLLLEMSALVVK
jgi:hypothetical protein